MLILAPVSIGRSLLGYRSSFLQMLRLVLWPVAVKLVTARRLALLYHTVMALQGLFDLLFRRRRASRFDLRQDSSQVTGRQRGQRLCHRVQIGIRRGGRGGFVADCAANCAAGHRLP
jgi:hypothetical protein